METIDAEVKAWNINNAPAFDLANFFSFLDTTFTEPGKLNARYFILGYRPANDGFTQGFTLERVYSNIFGRLLTTLEITLSDFR